MLSYIRMSASFPSVKQLKQKNLQKSKWFCENCGYESPGFLGRCNSCDAWGSFKEEFLEAKSSGANSYKHGLFMEPESEVLKLDEIPDTDIRRIDTKSDEFNRVLGGGIVPGSLTLIGGHPGIGKSTLLLQIAGNSSKQGYKVLYISAEESSQQLKIRASRLGLAGGQTVNNIYICTENNLEKIISRVKEIEANIIIIDSIQAIYLPQINSIPGSVSQIRESCSNLMRLAKTTKIPILIVGHINKDGDLAGPKILEHMVDTVLNFEGELEATKNQSFRVLRSIKNRFGSTDEIALFNMSSNGLQDVANPAEIFLKHRSGGIVVATREGKRSLLLELQSLVLHSEYNNPRRMANGIEPNRLHQILAVLEKKLGLALSKADVYLNIVGGLSIKEPAADLAVALSIFLSTNGYENLEKITKDLVVLGELGLSGEVRAITNIEARLKEAEKLGFKKAIIPKQNLDDLNNLKPNLEIVPVATLAEAVVKFQEL